jgi:hypothetical protein
VAMCNHNGTKQSMREPPMVVVVTTYGTTY